MILGVVGIEAVELYSEERGKTIFVEIKGW